MTIYISSRNSKCKYHKIIYHILNDLYIYSTHMFGQIYQTLFLLFHCNFCIVQHISFIYEIGSQFIKTKYFRQYFLPHSAFLLQAAWFQFFLLFQMHPQLWVSYLGSKVVQIRYNQTEYNKQLCNNQGNVLRGIVNWSGVARSVVRYKDQNSSFDDSFSNKFSSFQLETKNSIKNLQLYTILLRFKRCVTEKRTYHKVANRSTSHLVALPRIFRLIMKGKFDAYFYLLGKA